VGNVEAAHTIQIRVKHRPGDGDGRGDEDNGDNGNGDHGDRGGRAERGD
jgi:hypothetical protein